MQFRTLVTPLTGAFSALCSKPTAHQGNRSRRVVAALALSFLGLAAVAQPALAAATPRHTMQRFLMRGEKAAPTGTVTANAGTQYGLFSCQVIGFSAASCLDPYQMRRAYQIDSLISNGYDGTGQTIVIVDAFQHPTLQAQVDYFDTFYGLPAIQLTQVAPDGLTPFDPNDANMVGWAEEISLDVEWAHAIAPKARIMLVLAKSNQDEDIVSALNYAVVNNLGSVISMSFGENESCLGPELTTAYHNVFAAATAKNITLFASSADQGAALSTCDGTSWEKAVSSPATDPLVTGVGGTELTVAKDRLASLGCNPAQNPPAGTYQSEIVWNEGLPYGDYGNVFGYGTHATGGGFSVIYDGQPAYQKGVLPGGTQRGVPDVAYNGAIEHGVLTYLNIPGLPAGFYLFGGTSAGAPQWASIAAIANQRAGKSLGFLNTALYHIAQAQTKYAGSFHDITSGTNSSLQFDYLDNPVDIPGYSAGTGWDAPTGVGSPITPNIVDQLIQHVSPGDGNAVLANTKSKPNQKPAGTSKVSPH